MEWGWRFRSWISAHPMWSDALVAAAVSVLATAPFFGGADRGLQNGWTAFWVVPPACFTLVLRRRLPVRVWLIATVLGLVGVGVTGGPSSTYLPATIALYTLSVRLPVATSVRAALASALSPVVLLALADPGSALDATTYAMAGWSGVALMSGIAVRSQRAVVAAADERARLAEATREEEAQRRVVEERLRIARELHDVVAHHISVINVQAGVASFKVRADPDGALEALGHVRTASRTVLAEVPALLGLLRTDDSGLPTAPAPRLDDIATLVEHARQSGTDVHWEAQGKPVAVSALTELTAYRVTQEALTNARRHGVGPVRIAVRYSAAELAIEVLNTATVPSRNKEFDANTPRHGLIGMLERVTAAGGTVSAGWSEPGQWQVLAVLPFDRMHPLFTPADQVP